MISVAGCLNAAPPSAITTTTVAPNETTTSAPPTQPTPGELAVTLAARPTTFRNGETVGISLAATNGLTQPVWTNVGIVCTGSWDLRLYDASGAEVRIDDRDTMGCASGGHLAGTIAPGATAWFNESWNASARPRLGATAPLPPGDYTFLGSVRYGDHANASNVDGAEGVFARNASVVVHVVG